MWPASGRYRVILRFIYLKDWLLALAIIFSNTDPSLHMSPYIFWNICAAK